MRNPSITFSFWSLIEVWSLCWSVLCRLTFSLLVRTTSTHWLDWYCCGRPSTPSLMHLNYLEIYHPQDP